MSDQKRGDFIFDVKLEALSCDLAQSSSTRSTYNRDVLIPADIKSLVREA